ncbi:LemA family protein [uncultured Draconibacterium sp.]|uniref:LemA family protein n=1 Tax=uncultured Draconibacterium sp. TaxID=1573823 RepID=UPI0032179120
MTLLISIISGVIFLMLIGIISMYNGLIRRRNEVDNAFAGMDVQLKKRYELIPNLVATVKQYAIHEKELLSNITEMRAQAHSGKLTNNEKVALDNQISAGMKNILVAVEGYPDLKANDNFINLQRSLNEIEAQISAARRTYNAVITLYNNGIQTFPRNIIAGMMNMQRKEVFVIPEVERENVNVKTLF